MTALIPPPAAIGQETTTGDKRKINRVRFQPGIIDKDNDATTGRTRTRHRPPSSSSNKNSGRSSGRGNKRSLSSICSLLYFFVNVAICDSLGLLLESSLRCVLLVLSAFVVVLVQGVMRRAVVPIPPSHILKEAITDAAVALSALFPPLLVFALRGFSEEEDWEVRPLPTVLGLVDLRRYLVIRLGHAGSAVNITDFTPETSQDSWRSGCVLDPTELLEFLGLLATDSIRPGDSQV